MCGIAGFNWKDEKTIRLICSKMAHRGPDMEGYYSDDAVSLGHRRLSILDLSIKGKQPLSNKEKTHYITFNGEIFNYKELKKELNNYNYSTNTDTEVILAAYEKHGFECVKKLNGQFAFCIYDKPKKLLYIARDRIGINPLYYYSHNGKFIFGSELKTILESDVPKKINKNALNYYLAYGYTPRKQSILENTYKLEPGHYIVYDLESKALKNVKYWDIKPGDKIKDAEYAKKLILKQLEKSVKDRLVADVPVGAFLSGGIDSSAVVATISKYKKNLNTFSIKFDIENYDESAYAEKVAKHFGTKHHTIEFSAKDVRALIEKLAYHYDEPFADPSMIPTYLVSKVAREHVTVSLSGDGGDELFGGYTAYKNYRITQIQKLYPRFLNKIFYSILKRLPFKILEKPTAFFEIGTLKKEHKYARIMSYLNIDELKQLTGETPESVYKEYEDYLLDNYLNTAMNSDLHLYLPDDILTKVDRASLANSLESRPPLLDHDMIELACSISPKLKLKGKKSKYILKEALKGILPEYVLNRKKMGFGVPLKHYLKGELKDLAYKYAFNYDKHDHIPRKFLEGLKQKYEKSNWEKDYSRIIWTIMMFNMWWEKWICTRTRT
ncbi:asparagine synthase (glutamine-hydrolyzing) [Candidatus Woesearchaeota archaeon]|nr:MAG: asparagine synthase (glutamine-hydrolyzing) [Candidatus Woesearchaeota archaeon]